MKKFHKQKNIGNRMMSPRKNDHSSPEEESDHSGSDCDNDFTETDRGDNVKRRFDKPSREPNPDRTGIEIEQTPNPSNRRTGIEPSNKILK